MLEQIRRRLTYANVMSTIAVFGVLAGGGAYAASKIGPKDIKQNAVRSEHIKDGTIVARDINRKTRAALRGGRGPAGPKGDMGAIGAAGPKGDTGATGPAGPGALCEGNGPDDVMVKAGSVCIDRYEASIWTAATGGTQLIGTLPCAFNGQDCKGKIYARSVAGVAPRADITWFQAQQALANSGKRLPSNADWQQAVAGTPDSTACNVSTGSVANTGANAGCVSDWDANDMVGNLYEWVADWVPFSTDCPNWGTFSDDSMCLSGASTTAQGPGALFRGGFFINGASAGPFAVDASALPSFSIHYIGFRGAR